LLLASSTILGAVWAEYAGGRFWGWDPKEAWALITLPAYLALLHARRIGWVGDLDLAARSGTCFALIVVWAWYGVNFIQGTGLHRYGFGSGGALYVFAAVLIQEDYAEAAVFRRSLRIPAKHCSQEGRPHRSTNQSDRP
jgi:hypothetical protein